MKRILIAMTACLMMAGVASAQSGLGSLLGALSGSSDKSSSTSSLLNTVPKVVYSYVEGTTAVVLPGNWTYTGCAISISGDSVLGNVASTAASSTIESKVDEYLKKVGLTSGSMKFTFNEDLTFTCTIKGVPVNGTWSTSDNASKVTLKFGKAVSYLSMTGTLKSTSSGCEMLFNGKAFLKVVKTLLNYASSQSSVASVASSLSGNYNDMKIGFNLKKN